MCFQTKVMFRICRIGFQSNSYVSNMILEYWQYQMYVSNILFLFPNADDVSKRQCFQCMFPYTWSHKNYFAVNILKITIYYWDS